jgi:hypothetical protein
VDQNKQQSRLFAGMFSPAIIGMIAEAYWADLAPEGGAVQ